MGLSFRHRGLKLLFAEDDARRVNPEHVEKVKNILARLEVARNSSDMNLPGFRLHQLKGERRGTWPVTVSANWRVTFRFEDSDVVDIDYEDYH